MQVPWVKLIAFSVGGVLLALGLARWLTARAERNRRVDDLEQQDRQEKR